MCMYIYIYLYPCLARHGRCVVDTDSAFPNATNPDSTRGFLQIELGLEVCLSPTIDFCCIASLQRSIFFVYLYTW